MTYPVSFSDQNAPVNMRDLVMTGTLFYFILSSEINIYQKRIKVKFSLQN